MRVKNFIKEYSVRSLVCCFSGGKDSLVATHYTLSEIAGFEPAPEIHVVFVDTTVMLPITIEYVKEVCARYGWPLKILRPEPDFWTLAKKWGVPSRKQRWCCYHLKLKPIFDFVRKLPPQRAMIVGLRRDESKRRTKLPQVIYRKKARAWGYAPIIDWTEKDVLNYIKEHNLPIPPHYRLGLKETCMCGAFTSKKELMIMKALFPSLFKKFLALEEVFGDNRSVFFDRGKLFARELAKQKTLTCFIDELSGLEDVGGRPPHPQKPVHGQEA